jgi:hypothetical protein
MTTTIQKMRKYTPTDSVPVDMIYFDAGGTTYHTHRCPENQHTWMCNSPYCNSLTDLCPDHGGAEPVVIGREPWKR